MSMRRIYNDSIDSGFYQRIHTSHRIGCNTDPRSHTQPA